jgi:hypothetical protein
MTADGGSNRWSALALLGLVLALYVAHALSLGRVINDDAFISFRYCWQLAAANGLVYNPGEQVEGFSNPLWVLLLTPLLSLAGWGLEATLAVARFLGLAGGLAALVGLFGLSREAVGSWPDQHPAPSWGPLLPPALAAGTVPLAAAAMTGLETTMLAALLTLGLWALAVEHRIGRFRGAAVLLALAVLSRPEGVLLAGAAVAGAILAARFGAGGNGRQRLPLVSLAAVAGAAVLWTVFRWFTFDGEWLPNTYFAKQGGFAGLSWFDYLASGFGQYGLHALPLLAGLAGLWLWGRHRSAVLWPAAAMVLAHLASFPLTGSDWMPGFRLPVPSLPAQAALAGLGTLVLLGHLAGRRPAEAVRTWSVYLAVGLLLAGQLQAWAPRSELRHHLAIREAGYRQGHLALARWLREGSGVPAGGTVALMDIGLVGYLNPGLRVLDISGLTDRVIAKSPGRFLQKEYDPAYVLDQRPEAVVITLVGPRGMTGPLDPSRLEPGTLADLRLFEHPRFRAEYTFSTLFTHDHPEITYTLAAYLRNDL